MPRVIKCRECLVIGNLDPPVGIEEREERISSRCHFFWCGLIKYRPVSSEITQCCFLNGEQDWLGVGLGVGDGIGFGKTTFTPLLQANFFPDLIQVYV